MKHKLSTHSAAKVNEKVKIATQTKTLWVRPYRPRHIEFPTKENLKDEITRLVEQLQDHAVIMNMYLLLIKDYETAKDKLCSDCAVEYGRLIFKTQKSLRRFQGGFHVLREAGSDSESDIDADVGEHAA